MTSEPDSKPDRRPPTIELKATEVGTAPSAASASPSASADTRASKPAGEHVAAGDPAGKSPGQNSGGRLKSHAVSAGIGAIAMAAIVCALWIKGFVPSREAAAPAAAIAPVATAPVATAPVATTSTSATAPVTAAADAAAPDPALGNRMMAQEAQTKSFVDKLAALNHRVDDVGAASQDAAKSATQSAGAAQAAADAAKSAGQSGVQHTDIDALAARIAALESAVKTLSEAAAHPATAANDQAARLTIAAEALRAAVERNAPYQAELAAVQSLGVDQKATAPLAPYAASGLPSAVALAQELTALTPALASAANTASGETGFLGRLEDNAQKLVRITPVDAPVGNDPSAVIARITIDAAHADIAAALSDLAALPDSAKPLAADWVKKAQARDAAIAASRQIATDALAALSKPAAQ
jgi:hypothetical protein